MKTKETKWEDMDGYNRLEMIRKRKKMSVAYLAGRIKGLTVSMVERYESRCRGPGPDMQVKIAEVLGRPVQAFEWPEDIISNLGQETQDDQ